MANSLQSHEGLRNICQIWIPLVLRNCFPLDFFLPPTKYPEPPPLKHMSNQKASLLLLCYLLRSAKRLKFYGAPTSLSWQWVIGSHILIVPFLSVSSKPSCFPSATACHCFLLPWHEGSKYMPLFLFLPTMRTLLKHHLNYVLHALLG